MIKEVIESICSKINNSINSEGKFAVYTEAVKQGMSTPCFFVSCKNYKDEVFRGKRYRVRADIEIRYYFEVNSDTAKSDTQYIIERLWELTDVIEYENSQLRGVERKWENKEDGILFCVGYEYFYYGSYKGDDEFNYDYMEILNQKGVCKNGRN